VIREFIDKIRRRRAARGPVIPTPWGNVTESARRQAAANLIADPALRLRVLDVVVKECGGDRTRGEREFRRRYPEVPL
jgi:hypothetical protein